MSRRPRLVVLVALAALTGAPVVLPGLTAVGHAATPGSGTVSPTAPTVTFQGRADTAGVNPVGTSAGCPFTDPTNLCDKYDLTVDVTPDYWKTHTGGVKLTVNWTSSGNDYDVYVYDATGAVAGSSASSSKPEVVTLSKPSGVYSVRIAPFLVTQDQTTGTATFSSADAAPGVGNPVLPNGDPQGLAFSATVPGDPQRSQGEPAVTSDRNGRIYSCGPTGFSSVNDFATVSTDGGDQFHLVGTPPRGQVSTAEGGGDCALATAPEKNTGGDYQLAYAGLGPLTNFSTATSPDGGRAIAGSPVSQSFPGVDRQWVTFIDAKTSILTYNGTAPSGKTVQTSTDGGLTYGLSKLATADGGRIGQIRSFLPVGKTNRVTESYVYIPYSNGTNVKMALSKDGGATYSTCTVINAGNSPDAGFVAADNDTAGNVYFTYSDKGGARDTYLVTVPFDRLNACTGSDTVAVDLKQPKTRVNTGNVETTLFPWIAARGVPGRVAIAFYGTDQIGDPDSAAFHAAWQVYVTQSLDALSATPTVAMVQATTHPFHYDSICTAGLNCTINMADRSLVDYFTMDFVPGTNTLAIVYSQAAKKPDEAAGHVPEPAIITQVAGPSNAGGTVDRGFRKDVLRTSSPDPMGDALSSYSLNTPLTAVAPVSKAQPSLDLVGTDAAPAVSVGPELAPTTRAPVPGGGFTVTMKLKDLSDAALQAALTDTSSPAGSLVYLFRFVDGYQSGGVSARWNPVQGFDFAFTGYQVGSATCASSGEECTTYTSQGALTGKVDQAAGTIQIDVPLARLKALRGTDAANRPLEQPAVTGTRIYDATAFTLRNPSAAKDTQSFLEQVDNAPAFDFLVPADVTAPASMPEAPYALLLPVLAGGLVLAGVGLTRRRRRTAG